MRKLIFIFLTFCVLNSCLGMQEVEPMSGIPQFEEFSYVSLGGGSYELTASLTSPDACVAECGFIVDKQKRIVEGHSSLRDLETYSSVLKKNTFWAEVDLRKHISTRSIAEVWCCSYVSNGRDVILSSWQQIRYDSKDDDYTSGESVDLSADETANSYIVSEPGVYRFKAVKGNSSQKISNTSSADVLWESFGTSEEPSAGDLVRNVRLEDYEIYFRVPSAFREGNAVIAAKDASGKILWSWHIWLTDEPQECVYANGAGTMMDRNLGATSVNPGDVGTLGLMYQWGRKDPFLGSSSIRDSIDAASTYVWPAKVTSDQHNGTVEFAVEHPTTFILQNALNADWFYSGSTSTDTTRWQSVKTIYDPCPAGWSVPYGGNDGIWARAGLASGNDVLQESVQASGSGVVIHPGYSTPSTFYPTPGNRYRADGDLGNVGRTGYYWATGLPGNGHSGYGFWVGSDGTWNSAYYSGRANGQSVRCMRVGSASAPDKKEPVEVTVADFLSAAESQDDWYVLSGEIQNITSTIYGNFDLVDKTGSIYVYGLTASRVAANDKSFSSLGLKEGDHVTIIGQRGSYNGSPQVLNAYYVSHESASDASVWGVIGEVTGWGSSPDIVMQKTDTDGLFVAYRVEMPAGGFKIRANNEWNDAANYGLEHEATVEVDHAYELICGGGSFAMTIAAGTYDIWFDLKNSKIFIMTPGKTPDQAGVEEKYINPSAADFVVGISGSAIGWTDPSYEMSNRASFVRNTITDSKKFAGRYEFRLDDLKVAVNDEFKLRINGLWIGVEDASVEGLAVSGTNNFIAGEDGTYDITIAFDWDGNQPSNIIATFEKKIDMAGASDLSAFGTANCYMVSTAGVYKFPAVQGNNAVSVGAASTAEVLWESFGTSTVPSVGDLIKSVSYSDGYMIFQTADTFKEGNAVIAAKDASGKILWSWHIWLTDEPQECVYANGAGTMMDRNLGATSATPGDVGAIGLLYQWGRKDPFLGSSSINSSVEAASTLVWPASQSSSSVGTLEYAVEHPTTFITYNSRNHDWLYTGNSYADTTRWSSQKTVYDPCPAGWRVPDGGNDGVWVRAGLPQSFSYDNANQGVLYDGTIWYPCAGDRNYSSGASGSVAEYGNYWAVTPDGYFSFNRSGMNHNGDYYSSWGFSVRCYKEGSANVAPPMATIMDVTVAEFNAKPVSTTDLYRLKGTVTGPVNTTYGNFYLTDVTGKVYVYGVSNWAGYSSGFSEGATVTVVGKRGEYAGVVEVLECYIESYTPAETESPDDQKSYVYRNTSKVFSGNSYLMVAGTKAATPVEAQYGYIQVEDVNVNNGEVTADAYKAYVFTSADGGYTIRQSDGRYLYMSDSYNSFNFAESPSSGHIWSISFENSVAVITNNETLKTIQYDSSNKSFGAYSDVVGEYPVLYEQIVVGPENFESTLSWILGTNSYDHTTDIAQKAIVNGVMVDKVLKIGSSSRGGTATIKIPEGTKRIGFYAIAWMNRSCILSCTAGGVTTSLELKGNSGATGNPEPAYEITVTDSDYYFVDIPDGATEMTLQTPDGTNGRAILFRIQPVQ